MASIRELVGSDVHRVHGERLPFADAEFDRVVVVDMLEHVADDRAFVDELARVAAARRPPGGQHAAPAETALRRLRHRLGLTDERHGHVRPGYTLAELRALLEPAIRLGRAPHVFAVLHGGVDTAINSAWRGSGKGHPPRAWS